jgi:hypothetical protein
MTNWLKSGLRVAGERLRADTPLFGAIALYTALGIVFMMANSATQSAAYAIYVGKWVMLFLFFFPLMSIILTGAWVVHRFDARRNLAYRRAFSARYVGHLLGGTVLAFAILPMQGTFTSVKNAMFAWQGAFRFDQVQADIDKLLHFGVDPWRLVEPLVANGLLRSATEFNYSVIWFVLCFSLLYFVMTSPKADGVRSRYVAMFLLVWAVIGNVLAALFLSAGPAYYGLVTGDEARFAGLLAHLADGAGVEGSVAAYQDYLWQLHSAGLSGFGSGISAFPSVHVGLIAMNMMFAFEINRKLGIAFAVYTLYVMASSVALGWHYAIDGYVSVVVVAVMHVALGRSAAWYSGQRARLPQHSPDHEAATIA